MTNEKAIPEKKEDRRKFNKGNGGRHPGAGRKRKYDHVAQLTIKGESQLFVALRDKYGKSLIDVINRQLEKLL